MSNFVCVHFLNHKVSAKVVSIFSMVVKQIFLPFEMFYGKIRLYRNFCYLNAKLPALLSSLTQVTDNLPNSAVSPRFGQYWWHFTRPRSTMVVSIIIRDDWLSQVIYQKSVHVEARGPCVAIYLKNTRSSKIKAIFYIIMPFLVIKPKSFKITNLPVYNTRSWNCHYNVVCVDIMAWWALVQYDPRGIVWWDIPISIFNHIFLRMAYCHGKAQVPKS